MCSDAKDDHVYQIDTKCRFYRKTAIAIDRNGDYNDWKCSEEVLAELLLIPVSSKVPKSWPGDKSIKLDEAVMIYVTPCHMPVEISLFVSMRPLFEQNYQVLEASGDSKLRELDRIRGYD